MRISWRQIKQSIYNILGEYDDNHATDDEILIKGIITDAIIHSDIVIKVVPVKNTVVPDYLIIDESNQIYISIEEKKINMSNHNFLYKKDFNLNFTDELKKIIKEQLEIERKELKESLFQNEIHLLQKIKDLYN